MDFARHLLDRAGWTLAVAVACAAAMVWCVAVGVSLRSPLGTAFAIYSSGLLAVYVLVVVPLAVRAARPVRLPWPGWPARFRVIGRTR